MRKLTLLLLISPWLILTSCQEKSSPVQVLEELMDGKKDTCQLRMEGLLSGNRYTDFTAAEKVVLRDPGGAHWRLEVSDLFDCSMKAAYQLPPNESEGYPYFLADINYNNSQRKIGIRGDRKIYLIDLDQGAKSETISPTYAKGSRLTGADSGSIQHLEVWENYLVGATSDWGAFVFKLDSLSPTPIMPVAELIEGEQCHSLFLIETGSGKYQAILPSYNPNEGLFAVNPLFAAPIKLNPEETVYERGPYARVKKPDGKFVGIDIRTGKLLPVIEEKSPN